MRDEYSSDGIGWARFSGDGLYRYRLGRILSPGLVYDSGWAHRLAWGDAVKRVVFVMLNPSTADAFKVDPTVGRCCKFAARWGAGVLEVVNLFAFRSPYPEDLKLRIKGGQDVGGRGDNDAEIIAACTGASRVIAAWGANGALCDRGIEVYNMLRENARPGGDVPPVEILGRVPSDGSPMHPLARGKHYIPDDREPTRW